MTTLSEDLAFRGLVHQVSDPGLLAHADSEMLTVYAGFDPSADSLHVGNLMLLCTLRRFQERGHRPIAVAGGATGMIGDPGGHADERSLLSREELDHNVAHIAAELGRFLDFSNAAGERRALLVNNADWLGPATLLEFLRDVGKHFTVNQMVHKESVRTRIERPEQGISFTEFSYMLLQAADYLHLHTTYGCNLQIGGSDQWGNITAGIELIRRVSGDSAYALTQPLMTKADGTKFGKSESGASYLSAERTSPFALYQTFVRAEDAVVGNYLRYLTFLSHDEIRALDAETEQHPERRAAQHALAAELVRLVHGEEALRRAERASEALYSEQVMDLDEPTLLMALEDALSTKAARADLEGTGLSVVDLLVQGGLAPSKSEARRTISGGGAYVNNRRVADVDAAVTRSDLISDRYVVLRRGRQDLCLVAFA